ncbi:FKBP-type peptidyl-prolyl cis-trans isomerase [Cellvibrio japonicus]|uniref:Peptidyl-prolyl cis-trans isomerase n=1 Tax=Cellvibrio japonicus (strain Ueda107) TaxID=498211 RepID=B3PK91_CELJU|nr:FKBP-type peptidyl-prolyl cis-trans isomerase [Cellvibrio japonicus]ACE83704.1 peptidyl-prolyl cis-trans isomerase, FkbP family [Cellvibrio japonicus Ueda107]QEI11409.1 peptidylprolyl isomerase [Cellvibrio japonicus]QEI14983.1 peptidylprolyl isomerase [Cellvibrio japonicus]QEI18563.1 peptidylprolyl isomerase [Cellvibrio japonicus]
MQITADKVVSFHYRLSETGADEIESSYDAEPTLYLHGHNNLLAALEAALDGKTVGDKVSVSLTPEQAYGVRQEGAVQRIPVKHLLDHDKLKNKLKPGMKVAVNTQHGPWEALVLKVGKFNVDIDSNHPLAGKHLDFALDVIAVRDATDEEIAHGHAHGVGGHHHD